MANRLNPSRRRKNALTREAILAAKALNPSTVTAEGAMRSSHKEVKFNLGFGATYWQSPNRDRPVDMLDNGREKPTPYRPWQGVERNTKIAPFHGQTRSKSSDFDSLRQKAIFRKAITKPSDE